MITLIVAKGKNNEIGKDNQLLWHLPKDLQRFKKLTLNKPIIMGRKTFESLPGILPKRKHIVISRMTDDGSLNENVIWVKSIEEAIKKAKEFSEEMYIIGGGNIYAQTLNLADRLEITAVDFSCQADTFFPEIPKEKFQLQYREFHPKDEKNKYNFEFLTYETKK